MKKVESSLKNMIIVLCSFAIVTGGLLAYVNNITSGPIQKQAEENLAKGIKAVMGSETVKVEQTDTIKKQDNGKEFVYVIHNVSKDNTPLGAAVESSAPAFGGELKVLVGFNTEGEILGYTILQTAETPGLGAKADKWFQKEGKGNIVGKNPKKDNLTVSKDGGEIDAITASTITSRAFLNAVKYAYNAYMKEEVDSHSGASKQKH